MPLAAPPTVDGGVGTHHFIGGAADDDDEVISISSDTEQLASDPPDAPSATVSGVDPSSPPGAAGPGSRPAAAFGASSSLGRRGAGPAPPSARQECQTDDEEDEEDEEDDDEDEVGDPEEYTRQSTAMSSKVPLLIELRAAKARMSDARRRGHSMEEASAILDVAKIKLSSGRYRSALRFAKLGAALLGNQIKGASAIRLVVEAYLKQERFCEALACAEEYLAMFKASSDPRARGLVMLSLSEANCGMSRHKEALRLSATAAETFRKARDKAGQATALRVAAEVCLRLGGATSTKRALAKADEALLLLRGLGDRHEEAAVLLLIARVHLDRSEYDDAYAFAKGSYEFSESVGHTKGCAAALVDMATVLLAINEEPEAVLQVAQEALGLFQRLGDWLGEASAQMVVAKAHRANGLANFAAEALEAALAIARRLGERARIRLALGALVEALPPDVALPVLEEEVELARAADDRLRALSALQSTVGLQLATDKPEAALRSSELGLQLARRGGVPAEQALALRLVGEVHIHGKRLKEALEVLTEAKIALQNCGDVRGAAQVLLLMGSLHEVMTNSREALRCVMERRALYKTAGWKDEEASALLASAALHCQCTSAKDAAKISQDAIGLYRSLGEKSSEAMAMLALAELQCCLSSSVPSFLSFSTGGVGVGNRLLGRYFHSDPAKNTAGSGAGTNMLRTVQAARFGEAMRTIASAREIFAAAEDAAGEARALRALAEVHLERGAPDDAKQAAKEGLKACQKAGDVCGEAEALRAVAAVHAAVVRSEVRDGLKPDRGALEEAFALTLDAASVCQDAGDTPGQAWALLQLSGLARLAKQAEGAVVAAREACELAERVGSPEFAASALLELAEAELLARRRHGALEAAEAARRLLQELGDEARLEKARRLLDAAAGLPRAPVATEDPAADCTPAGHDEDRGHAAEASLERAEASELEVDDAGPAPDSGRLAELEDSWQAVEALQDAAERRREALLPRLAGLGGEGHRGEAPQTQLLWSSAQSPQHRQPPASRAFGLRQRTLDAAVEDRGAQRDDGADRPAASSSAFGGAELGGHCQPALRAAGLASVLQAVRPDWSPKEVAAVQEKLSKLGIVSPAELFTLLRGEGAQSLNTKLKAAGQKALRVDTLEALREYGDRLDGAAPASGA